MDPTVELEKLIIENKELKANMARLNREFKETTNIINAQMNTVINEAVQSRLSEITGIGNKANTGGANKMKRPKAQLPNAFEGLKDRNYINSWKFQISQYLSLYDIDDVEKIKIAATYGSLFLNGIGFGFEI